MPLSEARRLKALPEPAIAVALVGPGRVGQALLAKFRRQQADRRLVAIANSRQMLLGSDLDHCAWTGESAHVRSDTDLDQMIAWLQRFAGAKAVVIDATASREVADRHADWLRRSLSVVTANKWALAADELRWQSLKAAWQQQPEGYQASATVGAGLPVLSTLTRLGRCGETIHAFGGALSGSLNFLCGRINAGVAPSWALNEALSAGLTEPDPRQDLDGLDVARKLVILARAAGYQLDLSEVRIDSLVASEHAALPLGDYLSAGDEFDAHWHLCAGRAPGQGDRFVHVGRFDADKGARVGLERVESNHPLAGLTGAANLVEIYTDCYGELPLTVAGPGAGTEVTALALWADLEKLANS